MTRGDKGRRVFYYQNRFLPALHCYTCAHILVCSSGEEPLQSVLTWGTPAPQVPVGAEQRRQNSHSVLQEREQMVQTFTHTQIHGFL